MLLQCEVRQCPNSGEATILGVPQSQGYVEIEIPSGLSIEDITQDDLPRWDATSFEATCALGDRWYDERRSPILIVPSVVTRVERNGLINQEHPEFPLVRAGQAVPVRWDARLRKSPR